MYEVKLSAVFSITKLVKNILLITFYTISIEVFDSLQNYLNFAKTLCVNVYIFVIKNIIYI